jgi:hypothetical protein
VSFDAFGDGTGFDFRAVEGNGRMHVGGATVPAAPDLVLRVTTPAAGRIRLLRDGVEVAAREGCTLQWHDPAPGIHRVEVATTTGEPWLFSSSIRVLAPDQSPIGPR